MRRPVDTAVRSSVRWLRRVAPRIVDYGHMVLEDERDSANRDHSVVPIAVGDVQFKLALARERVRFAADYGRLSRTGAIYEPMMTASLTRVLQRTAAPRFMDVGAFLGYYALYVSALLGGREEVYAVESNPLYADAMRESIRVNGFSCLKVFVAALSDRAEPVRIDGLTVNHGVGTNNTMAVTLDELCERNGLKPTVIKMDVHGAEGKILLGMSRTLTEVECVLLELHRLPLLQQYSPGVTRTAVLDALEDSGLTLYYIGGHNHPHFGPEYRDLAAGRSFAYRKLDRQARDLLLFDRSDEFILATRSSDCESLLGPSTVPANY